MSGTATVTELTYEGGRVVRETVMTGATVITRTFTADEAGAIVRMTVAGDPSPSATGRTSSPRPATATRSRWPSSTPATGTFTPANRYTYDTWGTPDTTTHYGYGDLGFRYRYVGQYGVTWGHSGGVPSASRQCRKKR